MKKIIVFAMLFSSLAVRAEYVLNKGQDVRLGVGGYTRFFSGKVENHQFNNAMKSEGYIKPYWDINDDLTVSGKLALRYILDDRYPSQNKFRFYDAYVTMKSKRLGTVDVGDIRNVAYQMHQGSTDVGLFDIDDSDIYLFYERPSGFFAPTLSYLNTDSRDLKISYTTPDLSGFKWGVSAVQSEDVKPDSCADGGIKVDHGKGVITSVQYKQDLSLFKLGTSAGFAYYHDDRYFFKTKQVDANHSEYSLGLRLERDAFSVGASYRQMMFQEKLGINDTHTWVVGVAYDGEEYGVSLNYLSSQGEFNEKNTYTHLMLSGRYSLTEYVKATLSTGRLTWDNETKAKTGCWFAIAGVEFKI